MRKLRATLIVATTVVPSEAERAEMLTVRTGRASGGSPVSTTLGLLGTTSSECPSNVAGTVMICIAAALAGGLWIALAGWLRQYRGINETISSLLLIFARIYMAKKDILPKLTELGVEYWGAMYIPVVVAMVVERLSCAKS